MSTLFTYDMLRDIWVPLLSGIIGGLFTLIGVILTIKHERKKERHFRASSGNKTLFSYCSSIGSQAE